MLTGMTAMANIDLFMNKIILLSRSKVIASLVSKIFISVAFYPSADSKTANSVAARRAAHVT